MTTWNCGLGPPRFDRARGEPSRSDAESTIPHANCIQIGRFVVPIPERRAVDGVRDERYR
jgi:hypothetical protein